MTPEQFLEEVLYPATNAADCVTEVNHIGGEEVQGIKMETVEIWIDDGTLVEIRVSVFP